MNRNSTIVSDKIAQKLGEIADKIEAYAVEAVDDYHAVATGKLRNAIHVRLRGDASAGFSIECYAEGSRASYAKHVHEGREPGKMPPIGPLMEWAKKKMGVDGNPLFGGIGKGMVTRTRIRIGKNGIRANSADQEAFRVASRIAWGVAKNIEKHGIPEKPYFVDAVRRVLREM